MKFYYRSRLNAKNVFMQMKATLVSISVKVSPFVKFNSSSRVRTIEGIRYNML
jgi:hypothetical protein